LQNKVHTRHYLSHFIYTFKLNLRLVGTTEHVLGLGLARQVLGLGLGIDGIVFGLDGGVELIGLKPNP